MQVEKKYFGGSDGVGNYDDADFAVGPNQWINMENVRSGSTDFAAGATGWLESIGSTRLISNPNLPAGQNYCLGGAWHQVKNMLVWCNWNENGDDGIFALDIFSGIIYRVLLSDDVTGGLNFSKYSCIHSCFVINGNFYWTDSTNNQPRRINIDSGIKAYDPSYVTEEEAYDLPVSQSVISWIRRPPGIPPTLTKVTQTIPTLDVNFIKYEAFQARIRYVFRDYEVSTLSAMSALANYNRPADTYNRADIAMLFAEIIEQDVLQVDFVIRYVDGSHFIVKSWNKNNPADAAAIVAHNAGITPLAYSFYNDQVGIALDDTYSSKPFDSFPIYAETCATAKNRNFVGNYTIGYDTPESSSLTATGTTGPPTDRLFKSDATYQASVTFYDDYQRKTGYIAPVAARVNIPDRIYGTFTPPTFITSIDWTLSNVAALTEIPGTAKYYAINITRCLRTRFFLQLRGRTSTYVRKDADGNYEFGIDEYSADLAGCAFDISTLTTFGMGYLFAEGDIFKYYRYTDLNFTLGIIAQQGDYVITELQDLGTLNASTGFLFEIYTPYKPSTEEPAYEVTELFASSSLLSITNPGTLLRTYSVISGSIQGDVYIVDRTDSNKAFYVINPVDELRNDDQDATLGALASGVVEADPDFSIGSSPFRDLVGFNIATNTDRVIFENNSALDMTLYLSGNIQLMPDSDRTWRMYVSDNLGQQTFLVPDTVMTAGVIKNFTFNQTVTLAPGNRLFIFHHQSVANSMYFYQLNLTIIVPSSTISYKAEAMSPSDKFYKNWNFPDTGRENFIENIGQVTRENSIAFSNTYISGSKTNGLSTFDALDTKPVPQECGPISKLQVSSKIAEIGTVMLAICTNETVSCYLSEVQLVGASANAFLAQSPDVIGTINILKGSFGTQNAESVIEFRGNVYWFDGPNGKFIQYSPNGLFPVSKYKAEKFWYLFAEQYTSMSQAEIEVLGSRPFVFTGIDPHNEELLVSVPKVLTTPPKGYLPDYPDMIYPFDIWDGQAKAMVYKFNQEPNHWQGSYNIPAENFIYAKDEVYAFKDGQIYQMNSAGFSNFFGVQHKSRIMCLSNQIPSRPKVYDNLSLEVNIAPSLVYFRSEIPYVQASDLVDYDFINKEGVLYAKNGIYRNKLVPTATGLSLNGLLRAEKMRTAALRILLEFNTTDTPVQFKFLNIGYQVSGGHNT